MRRRISTVIALVVTWITKVATVVVAFQPSPFTQRYKTRYAADQISLFVQQVEPTQQQREEENGDQRDQNIDSVATNDVPQQQPYFAQDDTATVTEVVPSQSNDDDVMEQTPTVSPATRNFATDITHGIQSIETEAVATTTTTTATKPSTAPQRPQNTMFHPKSSSAGQELLEAVLDVTVAGSVALLKGLRYTAATALTASLPDQERNELLRRMKPKEAVSEVRKQKEVPTNTDKDDKEEEEVDVRGSVQEEIALAVREEARKSNQQWQQEKETITRQLEAAAEARMKSELEIQQQRLEKEKQAWKAQNQLMTERALTTMQQKIAALEAELQQATVAKLKLEEESSRAIEKAQADFAKKQQEQIVFETKELEHVEAMLKKRLEQQAMLEKVENDLREKAQQIKTEKEELTKLENLRLQQQQKLRQNVPKTFDPAQDVDDVVPHLSPKEYRSLSQEEKGKLREVRGASTVDANEDSVSVDIHPILGPVVADLGYKRIHLVSSGKLGTIPIWKRQRTYRNDRARRMASEKEATMHLGFPGIICLYEDSKGGLSILDGQHRVGMMQALREMQNKRGSTSSKDQVFQNVLVEVYTNPDNSTVVAAKNDKGIAEQVFLEINKAEPLKLLDMPGVASAADRKLITDAVETLQNQFPKMFSTSQRCRSPNVNIDNLRNSIYGANILKRHELTTSGNLVDWLMVQNAALGEAYERDDTRQKFLSPKTWSKASKNGFYLGLESSWLFQ
ncbi:hypothetical protein IV203_017061 [Nitzschia inconspicua]|uniref:Uncharacterized protein n=1 Tax=Nitzschia inconspicua TaxID=303405 RepID=A0A9K3PIV3_9STRA|nr:hypothetical protein IV203_017061 [Nitzschia inconspicua]